MQPPYRSLYDEDEDPEEQLPRSPLDLRGSYRSAAGADERVPRARDDDRMPGSRSGLPVRPSSGPGKSPSDRDQEGSRGLSFRRTNDDSASSGPPPLSPFGVRGDDVRSEEPGGRRLPLGRGKDDKRADKKPSRDASRDRSTGKDEKKGRLGGLPFGRGKDDKKADRPARPAYGGSAPGAPGRGPGGKGSGDEKKGRFGGLLGGKGKSDKKADDKAPARPGSIPPRRSSYDAPDDDRASRGFGSGAGRSSDGPPRSAFGSAPGPGDRDRSPFSGSATRSPLGTDSGLPRRSPLSPAGDDDAAGPLARPSGLGGARPPDRSALGGSLDRERSDRDRFSPGARPGAPSSEPRSAARSSLGGFAEKEEERAGGLFGKLPGRGREEKAPSREPAQPGSKAARSTSRALPHTTKAPRIVKGGLDLDRKLDLIGVSLVGFALVVFFAVLPSMSFGVLPPVTGGLTGTIDHFLSQLFGWGKIVWPITSAVIGIWLMMRYFGGQMFDVSYLRVVGAFSLYGCALTWLHFFELVNDPAPTVEAFRAISRATALDLGQGGGWFGHQFYLLLLSQLGDWGAVSVMIAWLIASLMLTFDVSMVELGQFLAAILAAFNFSPAQRALKREARATAQAATVGVSRPGEAGAARPRQMPLAPSAAAAGADLGAPAAADRGARSAPLIRRPGGAAGDAPAPPGETPAAETAEDGRSGLFGKLPGLRRTGAAGASKEPAVENQGAAPPATAATAGLGGRVGRFFQRDQAAKDSVPAADAVKLAASAALGGAAAASISAPSPGDDPNSAPVRERSGFAPPRRDRPGAAALPEPPTTEQDDNPADEADRPANDAAQLSPDRAGAAPAPGRLAGAGKGAEPGDAPDSEPGGGLMADFPRRPLPGRSPFARADETPAGGLALDRSPRASRAPDTQTSGVPTSAAAETAPTDAASADQPPERPLPFANPFRSRPVIERRDTSGGTPPAETPAADSGGGTAAMKPEPPARPGGDDLAPPRRTLPFSPASAASDEPPHERPAPANSGADAARPPERDAVRSFLDDIDLPPRRSPASSERAEPDPADSQPATGQKSHAEPPERPDPAARPAGLVNRLAGAGLASAALAGASARSGNGDSRPEVDRDSDDGGDTASADAPARPSRPPLRAASQPPKASATPPEDDEDDDLDLFDDDTDQDGEPDEEPLFETPARPKGLVRHPQRAQPQASDAGVRAANDYTERLAREDPDQTRRSDDFTRRAPTASPPERPGRGEQPVSRTTTPKRVDYTLPDISKSLKAGKEQRVNDEVLLDKARVIEDTLASFGAPGKVVEVNPGPVITQFGVEPDYQVSRTGKKTRVKVGSIARLDADLALALAARSIRIEAPVPGKGFVGIEVPNDDLTLVTLRDVIESPEFKRVSANSKLAIALGLGVDGTPVAADLTAMPHLLIAGTTGSGKSVAVNSIITCLLANNSPQDVQFIMVDPKRVELTGYNGIPHLVSDVVVDLERIVGVLQWVQREMEARYQRFADTSSRNIADYNRKLHDQPRMPYLVVVIDELADLMMLAPDETERLLARLAQMARATGIHLIISTQRPSVDIITGLIKANFPARIAFAVASSVDSRVILDQPGAEKLLGRGDMLYQSPDAAAPLRMQGVFVSDEEISRIINHWRQQKAEHGAAAYSAAAGRGVSFNAAPMDGGRSGASLPMRSSGDGQPTFWDQPGTVSFDDEDDGADEDDLYRQAVEVVQNLGKASISLLQRRLRIGYTRAARLIDLMEQEGIVGPAESGSKPREVLKYD